MTLPFNQVSINGQGQVGADQLNTYAQNAGTSAGLQNFVGLPGMLAYITGFISPNDGGQGFFYWNASGSANDGVNNIQPNGLTVGTWTRVNITIAGAPIIQCTATGTNTIALTPSSAIASYVNYQIFSFVAPHTSTGVITLNVSSVGALNAYNTDGATQLTTNDLTAGVFYLFAYNSALNSSAGGFQLVSNFDGNFIGTTFTASGAITAAGNVSGAGLVPTSSTTPALGINVPAANNLGINANTALVAEFNGLAGGVDNFVFQNASTGNSIRMSAAGTDTNIPIIILTKGSGLFSVQSDNVNQFSVGATASATNWVQVTGSNGAQPQIQIAGANANAGLEITGTGNFTVPGVQANTTSSSANVYVNSSGDLLRSTSSLRYKKNVESLTEGDYAKVLQLKPVQYNSRCDHDNPEQKFLGLIAEDVHAVEPRLVGYAATPEGEVPDYLPYERFVVLLIGFVQQLRREIDELKTRLKD